MENKKNINPSSIIDLKAELFRKQDEFKQQKLQNNNAGFVKAKTTEKKPSIWSKQNAGVLQRAQKDIEHKTEEEDVFEKSRKVLEKKSKLYEEISSGKDLPEEDGSKIFLVDFQKKAIDQIRDERNKQWEDEKRIKGENTDIDIPPPKDEGEEWVDYTDSLGRSRRCMKKDLPNLMARDKELQGNLNSTTTSDYDSSTPQLMSNDMRKEMLRQKWEKEELEAMNGPIHYSNVRYDEIRTHGVGFFEFDKTEEGRQEQLKTLDQLRQQTLDERSKKEKLKEKRKAMLDARLAKVKQRKMMREGGSLGPDLHLKEEIDIDPKLEEMIKPSEPSKPEPLTRDDTYNQNKPMREWDKGKEQMFAPTSEEKYYDDRRAERISEFAPPMSLYSNNVTNRSKQKSYYDNGSELSREIVIKREELKQPQTKVRDKSKTKDFIKDKTERKETISSTFNQNVSNIPLPSDISDIKTQQNFVNYENINPPQFDFSVPPPNFIPDQNLQIQTQPIETNIQYVLPPSLGQPSIQSQQYDVQRVNSGTCITHPSLGQPSIQSQQYDVQRVNSGIISDPSSPWMQDLNKQCINQHPYEVPGQNQSNIISNQHVETVYNQEITQTQGDVGSYSQTSVQPPKPKLNIIDPRYIQNQDVLSLNPGNLSSKSESNDSSECTISKDSNSYSGKPVVYK